jgi:hypothetical protein
VEGVAVFIKQALDVIDVFMRKVLDVRMCRRLC